MKNQRHSTILELIEKEVVETQEELVDLLRQRGLDVTQSTVSRDIKELQLIKIPCGNNVYRYAKPRVTAEFGQERLARLFRDSVQSVDYSENLIVINTLPGGAQVVASALDNSNWPEIIGTVAGDDTILVIIKPKEAVSGAVEKFNRLRA